MLIIEQGKTHRTMNIMSSVDSDSGKVLANESEVFVSMYDVYYKKWVEKFGPERIHIVNGDQLVRDPVTELHKIETFLHVPHYFSNKIFTFNATKRFYCWRRIDRDVPCPIPSVWIRQTGESIHIYLQNHWKRSKSSLTQILKNFVTLLVLPQ